MRTYKEITDDNGIAWHCYASDNNAVYILKSANAHDAYFEYQEKFNHNPSSWWYNRNFRFERVK